LRRAWKRQRAAAVLLGCAALGALVWCVSIGWWWLGIIAAGFLTFIALGIGSEAHASWARLVRPERKQRRKATRRRA
jgi:hypothetical protein